MYPSSIFALLPQPHYAGFSRSSGDREKSPFTWPRHNDYLEKMIYIIVVGSARKALCAGYLKFFSFYYKFSREPCYVRLPTWQALFATQPQASTPTENPGTSHIEIITSNNTPRRVLFHLVQCNTQVKL